MSQLAQFTSSATALARRRSRISTFLWRFMLLSCLGIVVYSDPLFPGYAQRRAFLPLPSSSSLAYCRRRGRASGGPLAVLPKIESTGAEPVPLARSLPFIGSRARLGRRLRQGSGIGTRSRHSLGFGI